MIAGIVCKDYASGPDKVRPTAWFCDMGRDLNIRSGRDQKCERGGMTVYKLSDLPYKYFSLRSNPLAHLLALHRCVTPSLKPFTRFFKRLVQITLFFFSYPYYC
jgi:hypothetical protein